MKKLIIALAGAVAFSFNPNSSATMLIGFNPFGLASGAANKPNPFNTTSAGTVSLATNVQLNAGLTNGSGATLGGTTNAWGGAGLNATSQALAIAGNDYYTLTLQAASGFQTSFTTINLDVSRALDAGITNFIWQYQIGGTGGFADIGTASTIVNNASKQAFAIDLSGISALQNVTQAVEFRFYGWGATSAASSLNFIGVTPGVGDFTALNFDGTVTAVPEPSTIALVAGGLGFVLWRIRRKVRA